MQTEEAVEDIVVIAENFYLPGMLDPGVLIFQDLVGGVSDQHCRTATLGDARQKVSINESAAPGEATIGISAQRVIRRMKDRS